VSGVRSGPGAECAWGPVGSVSGVCLGSGRVREARLGRRGSVPAEPDSRRRPVRPCHVLHPPQASHAKVRLCVTECEVLQVARARVVFGAHGGVGPGARQAHGGVGPGARQAHGGVGLGTRQARHRVAQRAGAGRQSDLGELGSRLRGGSEGAPAVRALAGIPRAGRGRSWRDAGWLRGLAKALGPTADRGGRGGGCGGWGGWGAWGARGARDRCVGRGNGRLTLGAVCARR
jgi:hypothetical protein